MMSMEMNQQWSRWRQHIRSADGEDLKLRPLLVLEASARYHPLRQQQRLNTGRKGKDKEQMAGRGEVVGW